MSVLIVFSLPTILFGQSHLSFDEQTLHFESIFSRPALEDVNRDGFPDLIVAQCAETGETQKRISVFFNRDGSFNSTPDHTFFFRDGEAVYDLADTDGDSDLELLVMGNHGVFAHDLTASGFRPQADTLLISQTILPAVSTEPPIRWPFASCASRNGFALLCIPESDGTDRAGYFGVLFMDAASVWFSEDSAKARPNFLCAGFGFHFLWDAVVLRSEIGFRTHGGGFSLPPRG